jgi:hypothetical protein
MVAGGPVLAQYCCGQRVELESDCAPESCCTEIESCCDAVPAESTDVCCEDDARIEVEFTEVGSLEATVASVSVCDFDPPCADLPCLPLHTWQFEVCSVTQAACDLRSPRPPDPPSLGVWRL